MNLYALIFFTVCHLLFTYTTRIIISCYRQLFIAPIILKPSDSGDCFSRPTWTTHGHHLFANQYHRLSDPSHYTCAVVHQQTTRFLSSSSSDQPITPFSQMRALLHHILRSFPRSEARVSLHHHTSSPMYQGQRQRFLVSGLDMAEETCI